MAGDFFLIREIECIIKLKGGVILNPDNLDEIIKKYSEALMEMGDVYGGEVPRETKKDAESVSKTDSDEPYRETATESQETKKSANAINTAAETQKNTLPEASDDTVNTAPAVREPTVSFPEGEATSSATFFTRVFTAEGAYPVEGAKVVVYRGDNVYAFLETDGEGRTKAVKLPAFPENNSLEEDNRYQSIEYFADVFARGFVTQKGLLVSSVGGSDIVLNVLMIPEEEGRG